MPDRLRSVGLRVTAARLAVLDTIPPGVHRDAEEVAADVRQRLGRVSTQAVYDVLRALTDAGLLRRVEIPGSPAARYERWLHDNHHHLVCRSCGDLVDVPCATGDAPCLIPTDAAGYDVDEAEVIYWGFCPACRARSSGT
jgi:Fe2+ or Zn2+ uptake regulation protein